MATTLAAGGQEGARATRPLSRTRSGFVGCVANHAEQRMLLSGTERATNRPTEWLRQARREREAKEAAAREEAAEAELQALKAEAKAAKAKSEEEVRRAPPHRSTPRFSPLDPPLSDRSLDRSLTSSPDALTSSFVLLSNARRRGAMP